MKGVGPLKSPEITSVPEIKLVNVQEALSPPEYELKFMLS